MERLYAFAPGLTLRLSGPAAMVRHFDAEYGRVAVGAARAARAGDGADRAPALEVAFVARGRGSALRPTITGSHKGTSWQVELGSPDAVPLRAAVRVTGPFGLSLVQSCVVEPLLAAAAVRAGLVLLPAAAVANPGGVVAIVGRSRTGKSSAAARALAAGLPVLGDDRFLLAPDGACLPFPRRLRAYADIARTAPAFVAQLPRRTRSALAARQALRRATRGFIDLPVLVDVAASPAEARDRVHTSPRLDRVVVVERDERRPDGATASPAAVPVPAPRALAVIRDVLFADLASLGAAPASSGWPEAAKRLVDRELAMLGPAVEAVPAALLLVPGSSGAREAIGALASLAGLPS